jgi:anti-anti-sigma factor
MFMLNATVQKLGDVTILHLEGRIVFGDASSVLRNTVLQQTHPRMLILDLAQVVTIDAGSLGVLLDVRTWAHSNAIAFKLMNAMNRVEQVFELTKLDRVFEFCSARELFCLLHRAAAMSESLADQRHPAAEKVVSLSREYYRQTNGAFARLDALARAQFISEANLT